MSNKKTNYYIKPSHIFKRYFLIKRGELIPEAMLTEVCSDLDWDGTKTLTENELKLARLAAEYYKYIRAQEQEDQYI